MAKLTKEAALKFLQESQDAEIIVRTIAEEEAFLNNYKTVEIENGMKPKVRELYDKLDLDILTTTGVQKKAEEKTYDYLKRVLADFKDQLSNADVKKLKDQLEELKKSGAGPELENVRQAAAKKEKELTDRIAQLNQQIVEKDIRANLNQALTGLKFKDIPKSVLDTYLEATMAKMTAKAKLVDGKVIFTKEDGSAILDMSTYQPAGADSLLKEELKDIIDAGIQGKGAGTKPANVTVDKDGKKQVQVFIPAGIKTQGELTEHLMKSGLARGSEEYNVAFAQYGEKLPLA